MPDYPAIVHHGAVNGVTGSCHELRADESSAILIDCGLFQGAETAPGGAGSDALAIDFPVDHVCALVATHVHIDHVGRIPYLLAAGFDGPIICSEPSARLLPLVLADALKIGVTRDRHLIERIIGVLRQRIVGVAYDEWHEIELSPGSSTATRLAVKLKPAGHILGSAYVQCRWQRGKARQVILFSGDLGAPWAPLLAAPRAPWGCDVVVLESTYGDRDHENRRNRRQRLQALLEHALRDRGTVLVPAFSIGRTQELLYELEDIIHRHALRPIVSGPGMPSPRGDGRSLRWGDLEIVVDSPLASRFTEVYRNLRPWWDAEALGRVNRGRHPLSFEQLTTIDSHDDHLRAVEYLNQTGRPSVVIAASGMCSGGRVVNYLKAMVGNPRHDILFVGYQARGTPGRAIQKYGPRGGWVELDGERHAIRARVHTLGGYSAHAGQKDLINFVRRMRRLPRQVRLIHGDSAAKVALKAELQAALGSGVEIVIPV